jgi:hypothetical protein
LSFKVNDNLFLNIFLYVIAFGILIGSGSLFRYAYSYNIIMFITILLMIGIVFYRFFIPAINPNGKNLYTNELINYSGLILIMFFIFFPIMIDVINQVKSNEIIYFHTAMMLIPFLMGAKLRGRILSYYLNLMVILSIISFVYFFTDKFFELPSFLPYWGIKIDQHFYYVWSKQVNVFLFTRNQSIFWEPGAFGYHLIISTLLAYKIKNRLFLTILIIACLTTMSTTVYIFLYLLVIYQLFYGNNKIRFIGIMSSSLIIILIIIWSFFKDFEIPLLLINIITDKFSPTGGAYASMVERTLFTTEAIKLFFDNIFLGAGHYSTDVLLKNIGSETSGLAGLLAELGIFGVFCILLYVRFFKHFKILALPIALIWLNGEFMQYTPISLFILTHMVDDIGQKLFPAIKIDSPN